MAIERLSAPVRFTRPSAVCAGRTAAPRSGATVPTCMRLPRGSSEWRASAPQCQPPPGASDARARVEPSITASAPSRWPSRCRRSCRGRRRQSRARSGHRTRRGSRGGRPATSATAVAIGAWMPRSPGSWTPRRRRTRPAHRCARAHEVQCGRVGGSAADDDRHVELVDELLEVERLDYALLTCSALTVVPRITNRSTPASTTVWYSSWVRCGLSAPATGTPAARISASRCVTSSGLIGSA